jgi:hypothetical protein
MKKAARTPALLMIIYLGGCATGANGTEPVLAQAAAARTAEEEWLNPTYGPEERLTGVVLEGFEASSFLGCWLEWTPQARRELVRLTREIPLEEMWARAFEYELDIVGRRTVPVPEHLPQPGYGHLSAYPCQIIVTSLLRARERPLDRHRN